VLGSIAEKHGVRVSQLKAWNDLNTSVIRVGQKLIIHADPNKM
jgi:membrane-bound lytic murein transglycosylase D